MYSTAKLSSRRKNAGQVTTSYDAEQDPRNKRGNSRSTALLRSATTQYEQEIRDLPSIHATQVDRYPKAIYALPAAKELRLATNNLDKKKTYSEEHDLTS